MPQYNEYDPISAQDVDTNDIMLWEVDGVTYKMSTEEQRKSGNIAVINYQTGTSYSLVIGDLGKAILMTNAGANTVTVPLNSVHPFPIGTQILVKRMGTGVTTIVATSGVEINTPNSDLSISTQFATGYLLKYDTDKWTWEGGAAASTGGTTDTTAPTVVSAAVTDSTHIQIVFSESVTVTTAGWSFKKNGSNLAITSVSGSGTTWTFLVASMASGDTILRSYNSTTGATVDGSANELVTFTDQAVTNSLGDTTAPTVTSATVETAQPNRVVMNMSEAMDSASIPAVGQLTIGVNGFARTTTSITISGSTVNVNFDGAAVVSGDTVTRTYAVPGSNPLQDLAGNDLAAFTAVAVTNNVAGGATIASTAWAHRYDPAEDVTTTVSGADTLLRHWYDQMIVSGSRPQAPDMQQETEALRPFYHAAVTELGGLPGVRIVTGKSIIGNWTSAIPRPYSIFFVANFISLPAATSYVLISPSGGGRGDVGHDASNKALMYAGSFASSTTSLVTGQTYLFLAEYNNDGTGNLYAWGNGLNGVKVMDNVTIGGSGLLQGTLQAGHSTNGANAYLGDIAVRAAIFNSTDRASLAAEFIAKYPSIDITP